MTSVQPRFTTASAFTMAVPVPMADFTLVVPALAVSLTRRPEESAPHLGGVAAVIYLPLLDAAQATMLLSGLHRRRGVSAPPSWRLGIPASPVPTS